MAGTALPSEMSDFVLTVGSRCGRPRFPEFSVSKTMATKQARGTKRTCQSSECDARFYDLERSPIVCPICGTLYELASSPLGAVAAASEERAARRGRKSDFSEKASSEDGEETDETAEIEDGDDESISTDGDETFLEEEEEEGGDVSNIIGGAVKEGNEER